MKNRTQYLTGFTRVLILRVSFTFCLCTCCPETGRFSLGQNVALNAKSWTVAIDLWHEEVNDFTYGDTNYDIAKIGHYTQVLHGNHCRSECVYSD